ncbi:hypothetical protein DFJ58DRAFT_658427 [Suillus subalutaceus]|uniref:uncharacterized protein n=1 Tax=Suillus subalutaceus TaxID=48586 RepID=UPI001B85EEFD|nr:uncharacterized protein DFJ58DRAFT_658427 [Suillus subalutaceus]KAG1859033.1 hypothetical protein DFJ58DRAFT_658427 [Suillus subalutaceus]
MRLLLCVFLYLVGVIQATNTTTTTSDSFKVPSPSFTTRTLWTIVSSSVLTLFACVYSAIHPNIPSPKHSPGGILLQRLGITIMALIAPELIATWAMRQWLSARQVTKQFETSGYYDHTWTQTHSFFVLMGGFMLYVDGRPCHTLRPDYILKLIREGYIDAPTLTAEQIHDRSKGDAISKGLVVLQVGWFVMQLITRVIYNLEITLLEVGTFAFAVLNFLTYAMWWNKPLNVEFPHPVYWKSTESKPEDHIEYVCASTDVPLLIMSASVSVTKKKTAGLGIMPLIFRPILELIGMPGIPISRRLQVPTFDGSIKLKGWARFALAQSAFVMAAVFGAIHVLAWNVAFPIYQEQVLWNLSGIAIVCAPSLGMYIYIWLFLCRPALRWLSFPICILYVMLYVTARAILLVLMFATLDNLPPDAYKAVSWTSFVPHL